MRVFRRGRHLRIFMIIGKILRGPISVIGSIIIPKMAGESFLSLVEKSTEKEGLTRSIFSRSCGLRIPP